MVSQVISCPKFLYVVPIVLVADARLTQEQMAIFVKNRKDLSPFGGFPVVDANSRQAISEDRKSAYFIGRHWNHVGKDSAIFYQTPPMATSVG